MVRLTVNTDTSANSVDLDETAHNELPYQEVHNMQFHSVFKLIVTIAPCAIMDLSKFISPAIRIDVVCNCFFFFFFY